MQLQKQITDTSMFEKKKINLQQFKDMLVEYQLLDNHFSYWGYNTEHNQLKDKLVNYIMISLPTLFPWIPAFILLTHYFMFLPSVIIMLFAQGIGLTYCRNLKFGIFKNRYKKWQNLKKDIENVIQDNSQVFSLLLDIETKLKNLQNNIVESEELKILLNQSIENLIEELKQIFANFNNTPENLEKLIEKLNEIGNYENEMVKAIKTYQLKTEYIDYKREQGIIENEDEKQLMEKNLVRDFKAIL